MIGFGPGPALTCPSCRAPISWRYVSSAPFSCPACGYGLRLKAAYYRLLNLIALVVTALVLYALGVRGDQLLAGTCLAWLPVRFLVELLNERLFPPELEPTGDIRGILHPVDPEVAEDVFDREMAADADEGAPNRASPGGAGMFVSLAPPWTLEGFALRAGAGVLLLWSVWVVAEPVVHNLFPRLGSTLTGPSTFPVTIQVGDTGVDVANGAMEPWQCQLALGVSPTFITSVFPVESRRTRTLSYQEFKGTGERVDVDAVRRAARDRVMIECREPSGRPHLMRF